MSTCSMSIMCTVSKARVSDMGTMTSRTQCMQPCINCVRIMRVLSTVSMNSGSWWNSLRWNRSLQIKYMFNFWFTKFNFSLVNYYYSNLFIDQNGTEQMTINFIYILSICTFWFFFDFIKCAEENNKKYIGKD